MFGVTVEIPSTEETTALGAAINEMVSVRKSYIPRAENTELYDRYFEDVYEPLYSQNKELMARSAKIGAS